MMGVDILHIENNDVDIQEVEREFRKVNALLNIAVARDGIQALDKLYGRHGEERLNPAPKMILLDITLPRMDGIAFLKELRRDSDFNLIAIYVLTAAYTTKDKLALRNLRVGGCIVKPLEYAEALDIFWSLLSEKE